MSIPHRPQNFPTVAPWVATATSVTVPPLASDSKSLLLLGSVFGKTTHNHGPSIVGPTFGNPGLSCQTSSIFLRNSSSEMLFDQPLQRRNVDDLCFIPAEY